MYSFISSFKKKAQVVCRERSVRNLLVALALIILIGFLFSGKREPARESDLVKERFWALKTRFLKAEYNVVVCGDSRVYRGISPAAMNSLLPGFKIVNFGYSLGSLDRLMMKNAESLLDPKAKNRVIVLGVTPSALTPLAAKNEQYLSIKRKPFSEVVESVYFLPVTTFLMPIRPKEVKNLFSGAKTRNKRYYEYHGYETYYDDGWVAAGTEDLRPEKQLSMYRARFISYQVSPDLSRDLLEVVREWKSKGIQVFGYRPPTTHAMVALEDSMSGFREAEFIREFESVGGIWLRFNIDDYVSYDGSHLAAESAKQFSRDLAAKIRDVHDGEITNSSSSDRFVLQGGKVSQKQGARVEMGSREAAF